MSGWWIDRCISITRYDSSSVIRFSTPILALLLARLLPSDEIRYHITG